ncbi:MAG: hypothetical protein ACFFAO_10655 [Candidatus Hermodarchaeota archaeon]
MTENKKKIIEDIMSQRRLPYSIELIEVKDNKYIVRNTFGSTIVYVKKGDNYILED